MQFYIDLPAIESCPDLMRMKQMMDNGIKSIEETEFKAKEVVAKAVINKFGYPNDIVVNVYQASSKVEFVNIKTNEILASVETINDGIMFYTETKYYGDWCKCVF